LRSPIESGTHIAGELASIRIGIWQNRASLIQMICKTTQPEMPTARPKTMHWDRVSCLAV
jgi:hypothetical protein